jgi:hypothetical protein
MTKGRPPKTGLDGAVLMGKRRGMVMEFLPDPATPANFLIQTPSSITFVRVRFASRLHGSLIEILTEFREPIERLRSIPASENIGRELWIYSRYGFWRYFLITDMLVEEIGSDGMPASTPVKRSVEGAGETVKEKPGVTTVQG